AGRETDPVLLDRLMSLPPGAELELVLAGLDPKRMSAVALIEASKACVRMATHHQAQFHAAVVEAMSVLGDRDLVVSQIAAALRLTRREAEEELDLAMSLNPVSTGDV